MGRLTVRLPDALHRQLEQLARSEGGSLNQYLVYALTRQATLDAQAQAPAQTKGSLSPAEPVISGRPTCHTHARQQNDARSFSNRPDEEEILASDL